MPAVQFKDYYAVMGVAPEASQDAIKTAYRTLARKFHPDVNKAKDANQRFSAIGEAYEALGDPDKRKAYDEVRKGGWQDGQEYPAPGARSPPGDGSFTGSDDDFSDFFSSLFGAKGRRERSDPFERESHDHRGEDLHYSIELTLEELYSGGERDLQMQVPTVDETAKPQMRKLHVTIPKGLSEGEHIRLRGQGWPGTTRDLDGSLYLTIGVKTHAFYRVEGRDILLDLPLTPWEAALGAQVPTPTLGGTTTVTIPPNSRDGQRMRLRGRGLPGTPAGDQYVTIKLTLPPTTNDQAKELWKSLAAASPYNPRNNLPV